MNLDKLRELAEKATPGPWVMTLEEPDGFPQVFWDEGKTKDLQIADMNYIDALSPDAVIRLLDEVKRLRKDRKAHLLVVEAINCLIQHLEEK